MPDSTTPRRPASPPAARAERTWTTRDLLTWITGHLESRGVDSARLVAEMLLGHVIGCERMRLYMEVDRPAAPAELTALRVLVTRAAGHEPVQYLVGQWGFFGRDFEVDRSTLIPRPSTETLVEQVVGWGRAREDPGLRIADLGTGTGCVAISLAMQLKSARIVATDIVPAALELARRNAERHRVTDRIDFRLGATWDPVDDDGEPRFDCVCSNPPYVADDEWADLEENVRSHEPPSALRAGAEGLDVIRPLIAGAADHLRPGGRLVLEIGHAQREPVLALVKATDGLTDPEVLRDHEGLWRVVVADRAG